jgi:hypothetical protein
MNEKLAAAAASAKNFVSRHKVAVTAVVTTAICVGVQMKITEHWNEFLTEHNLLDTYYHMDEED